MQDEEPNSEAADRALPVLDETVASIYRELRLIARRRRSTERSDLTLQTTTLVHEAWIRLVGSSGDAMPKDNEHLKAVISRIIRHVLVDYGRRTAASKRNSRQAAPGMIENTLIEPELNLDLLDLDAALHRLAGESPRLEKIVECRFFGGMSIAQTAEALAVSTRTVERDWLKARAYLLDYLGREASGR